MKITILIADDQPLVRRTLRMSLDLEEDFLVVGEAQDGLEAVEMAAALSPDVVVMDLEMPQMDGVLAASLLKTSSPGTAVVIHSLYDQDELKQKALQAGAFAFVPKHALLDNLIAAVREAAASRSEDDDR
ncbi:MAG TPA: response regulator transcription factor [Anaerolineales bacterium]|nr:response regulator transcription factor [Anaerolineales bacterium]